MSLPDKAMIRVTQQHIDAGQPLWGDKCPVALAAAQQYPAFNDVFVGKVELHMWEGEKSPDGLVYPLPGWVVERVHIYDKTGQMKPFEFELPEPIRRYGKYRVKK